MYSSPVFVAGREDHMTHIVKGHKVTCSSKPTKNDADQIIRFQAAVQIEIAKKKLLGKPIAKYDIETGKAYLEYPDGKRQYER